MSKRFYGFGSLVVVALLVANTPLHAQPVFTPDSEFGPYVHQATLKLTGVADEAFGRFLAIRGDVALVAGSGVIYVFERDPQTGVWTEVSPIGSIEEVEGFARAIAVDGNMAVVGAQGAAYLFRRRASGQWRYVATLHPSDGHPGFGSSVAINGNQVIVGATAFSDPALSGAAYIFRREPPGFDTWNEIAIRTGGRSFGGIVGITRNAAFVSEAMGPMAAAANIFMRDLGGPDGWGLAARPTAGGGDFAGGIAIDRGILVFGRGEIFAGASIYGRNVGAPDSWGLRATYGGGGSVCCGTFGSVEIDADRIILGLRGLGTGVDVLSRNQGGLNAWQRIARFREPSSTPPSRTDLGADVAIGGDTALLGVPGSASNPNDNVVLVLVSDEDGDGIRDGVDTCPRDPLNNMAGRCQRESAAHPLLDYLITQDDVTSETRGQRQLITATFTNASEAAVKNPFFEVTELTGGNRLLNADEGQGGVGATLSPDVGDGVLSPGESMTVTFRIHLETQEQFQFHVSFHGDLVQQ